MESLTVLVNFMASTGDLVRNAQAATKAIDDVSDATDESARSAATATVSTGKLSAAYLALGRAADTAKEKIRALNRAGGGGPGGPGTRGGGLYGGSAGRGAATDVGSAIRQASNLAQGLLGFLGLIAPTINIIIAALVGMVALLTAGAVAAAAVVAALGATAAAMAFASYKWRELLMETERGAETWQGALIAVEAEAFRMAQGVVDSFRSAGDAGTDMWAAIGEAGVKFLRMMEPYVKAITDRVKNFVAALSGAPGAASPFLDFLRTWIAEWKVLLNIVNQDIPEGGGILGFFKKYEAPAKAFVRGIAEVINGIRKMSAMGLGLNMDQLAESIRNVFHWLAQMVQVFPKFSNALVTVFLQLSRFLNEITPVIALAFDIGSAILQHIVAPLLELALVISGKILNLPIVKWLVALAGGFALVAFAIAKLTFNSLTFTQVLKAMAYQFVNFSLRIGVATAALLGFNIAANGMKAFLLGGGILIAAAAGAWLLFKGPMEEVRKMYDRVKKAHEEAFAVISTGGDVFAGLAADYERAAAEFNDLSGIEETVFRFQHFFDLLAGETPTTIITAEALDRLKVSLEGVTAAFKDQVIGGSLSEKMISDFQALQEAANQGLTAPNPIEFLGNQEAFDQAKANFEAQEYAGKQVTEMLTFLHSQLDEGAITYGTYATWVEKLKGEFLSTAEAAELTELKIKGAAYTIAQALLEVQKNGDYATGALHAFAVDSGQDFEQLRADAVELLTGPDGLIGTGKAVTEFFLEQRDYIQQWKTETAESFNFVADAFAGLAGEADLTFAEIEKTLKQAAQDSREYQANLEQLVKMGASDALIEYVRQWGIAGASAAGKLVEGGRKGIERLNGYVRRGGDQAKETADVYADALGVTMERLTAAIVVMISEAFGISKQKVNNMVDNMIDQANRGAEGVNRALARIDKHVQVRIDIIRGSSGGGVNRTWDDLIYGHSGGMVSANAITKYHGGGMAGDERLAILQTGEFVMSRAAVDRVGLDTLQALNGGAQSSGSESRPVRVQVVLDRRRVDHELAKDSVYRGW